MRVLPVRRDGSAMEYLEKRLCLACTVEVHGHTLSVVGDDDSNVVGLIYDGAGAVSVECDGDLHAASGIRKIVIDMGDGNDSVDVTLTGELTVPLQLDVELGDGDDLAIIFTADIFDKLKVNVDAGDGDDTVLIDLDAEVEEKAHVNLDVNGGAGNDELLLSIDEVRAKAHLHVNYDGGTDNDRLEILMGDPIDEKAHVNIDATGGEGNDALLVDGQTFGIAAGAELNVNLEGGNGQDALVFAWQGDIDGKLNIRAGGDDDNDLVNASVTVLAGSTGKVNAELRGDGADDDLTLSIADASGGAADIHGLIDGGSGFDMCVATPNVQVKNCEA